MKRKNPEAETLIKKPEEISAQVVKEVTFQEAVHVKRVKYYRKVYLENKRLKGCLCIGALA